jgi:triacylglycerol lipase
VTLRPSLGHLVALAVIALAVAGLWLWRWARARRLRGQLAGVARQARAAVKHPIVLAHGLLGFDEVKVGGLKRSYFNGVAEALEAAGGKVYTVRVPGIGSVAERAEALTRAVRALDERRVNIIAHSMGGLDARYAISRLGLSKQVASLTTIGTPHQGTPVADIGTGLLGDTFRLKKIAQMLGMPVECFYDLTMSRMAKFNDEVPDARGVSYGSFIATVKGKRRMNPLLLPTYLYLADRAGENDGLVPAASQKWGEVFGTVEADHWAQIGWSKHFDAPGFYGRLLASLRERGL